MTEIVDACSSEPGHPSNGHRRLQPALHRLVSCVAAPALVMSAPDGQLDGDGAVGWYVDDVRLLRRLELGLEETELEVVSTSFEGSHIARFRYVARGLGDDQTDPTILVDRVRTLTPTVLRERVVVSSYATMEVKLVLSLHLASDLAALSEIRVGGDPAEVAPQIRGKDLGWSADGRSVRVEASPRSYETPAPGVLTWKARLPPGGQLRVDLTGEVTSSRESQFPSGGLRPWATPRIQAADHRVHRLVRQGLDDLAGLALRDGTTRDRFVAAGSPWFLTLFGRDSLWTARMLLPLGTDLALMTLRSLARRQGVRHHPAASEEPGKILHEVRSGRLDLRDLSLPPLYYGAVDTTPLFVVTLAEAWRWGADADEVRALLPAARRCLEWTMAAAARTGWLQYVDTTGHGLTNQGWKDSEDSVQFADGRLAVPPIALSEVQAYAYQAAVDGARLLEAFGEPQVDGLQAWARDLKARFRDTFWVRDDPGDYPAIALDGSGARVDARASNMGHLLGTGLLDPSEAAAVASALTAPDLDSGFGLRTISTTSARFSPLSYHGGTVWPHDTAVACAGLSREGFGSAAGALALGLVRAAEAFDYRLPELYGGDALSDVALPSAYPAACRPQAWAAAAPLAALVAVAGLRLDVPAGILSHAAYASSSFPSVSLHGLRVGTSTLDLDIAADGRVRVSTDADVRVVTEGDAARTG